MDARFLTPAEEHDLILKAQAGDLAARDRVIAGVTPLIYREAISIARLHPPAEAEDLAQEGLLIIMQRFDKFNPDLGYRFSTYFKVGARRVMVDLAQENGVVNRVGNAAYNSDSLRQKKLKHAGPLISLDEPFPTQNPECEVTCLLSMLLDERGDDDEPARREIVEVVRACVGRLRRRDRHLVEEKMAGKKLREMGTSRGRSKERCRQLLFLALHELKKHLLAHPVIREFVEEKCDERNALRPPRGTKTLRQQLR